MLGTTWIDSTIYSQQIEMIVSAIGMIAPHPKATRSQHGR